MADQLEALRQQLLTTGDVPKAERSSPVGKAWAQVKSYGLAATPAVVDQFLETIRGGGDMAPMPFASLPEDVSRAGGAVEPLADVGPHLEQLSEEVAALRDSLHGAAAAAPAVGQGGVQPLPEGTPPTTPVQPLPEAATAETVSAEPAPLPDAPPAPAAAMPPSTPPAESPTPAQGGIQPLPEADDTTAAPDAPGATPAPGKGKAGGKVPKGPKPPKAGKPRPLPEDEGSGFSKGMASFLDGLLGSNLSQGGGGGKEGSGGGNKDLQEAIEDLTDAVKALTDRLGRDERQAKEAGPQADGSFTPGGEKPMAHGQGGADTAGGRAFPTARGQGQAPWQRVIEGLRGR